MEVMFPNPILLILSDSNRESFRDYAGLFAFVQGEGTDGGAGTGAPTGVSNFAVEKDAQARLDESPCPHILRFLLAPDQSRIFRKGFYGGAQLRFIQRIKLFDSDDGGVPYLFRLSMANKIEVDLAGAENHAVNFVGVFAAPGDRGYRIGDDFVKFSADEVFGAGG